MGYKGISACITQKKTYRALADKYAKMDNKEKSIYYKNCHYQAKARLHYSKFTRNEELMLNSLEKFEEAHQQDKFFQELCSFCNVMYNAGKMVKEKFMSVFYFAKTHK